MLGFILNRLRKGQQEVLEQDRQRLVIGAPSQEGDFIECAVCGRRWEFDPTGPAETNNFAARYQQYLDHVLHEHSEDA